MIIQLKLQEKQLYSMFTINPKGNQILPAIKKIIMIDQEDYIRQLKNKLGMIQNEQTSIDLVLDENEIMELLAVLQRIIQVGKKTVKNYEGLDEVGRSLKSSSRL
jgi:hypothetical protein